MNCSPNFTEWSREEKEEFAKRRMDEMKLKNEKLLQRHAEVENDRIKAESRNSAVTGAAKAIKKEKNPSTVECNKEESKVEHAREWDRGKPDKDHWKSPEHHGSSFKNYRSSGRFERKDTDRKDNWGGFSRNENTDRPRLNRGTDGRYDVKDNYDEDAAWGQNPNKQSYNKPYKTHPLEDPYEKRNADRKDTWSGYSRNENTDHYRHDHASDARKLRGSYRYKQNDNNQHGSSRLQMSPKRTRGVGYRNNDSHRKSQSSYSDGKYKRSDYNLSNSRKKYSYRAHSRSTSRSGSDYVENQFTIRAYNLWQNDKISEDQTKQNRVEKWVKSVNKTNMWGGKQFTPEQKDKNTSKFTPEQKDKNTSKVPSEQKDKNSRSYSKFDRFEGSPNKSSEEEEGGPNFNTSRGNKTCENSNYTSQRDYSEKKNQNKGASYNIGSAKQIDGLKKKGVQTKRSPQYSSGSSSKNGNFRKQRRFDDRGQKNDDDRNRFKPKRHDNTLAVSETWKNSAPDNTGNKNSSCDRYPKLDNTDTWNEEDDGIWGNADQSDIKWKISDEETDLKEAKNQNRKQTKKNINTGDSWNDNQISTDPKKGRLKEQHQVKDKNENKKQVELDNDDGIWSNVEQSDVHWKSDAEAFSQECKNQNLEFSNSKNNSVNKYTAQKATKPDDGWEDYVYPQKNQSCVKGSSEGKDEDFQTSGQMTYDSGANQANITECHSSSASRLQQNSDPLSQKSHSEAEMIISSFKRSVCISDERSTNVSIDHFSEKPVASDDGGWSTVSEEGEIRSDDGNANKSRKLYKRKHCD